MKLHHTKYTKNYRKFILDCIYEDNECNPLITDEQKIDHIFDRIESEIGWNVERVGKHDAIAGWLSGMAIIGLPIYRQEIIELAQEMGSADSDLSDREEEKLFNNYYKFMANQVLKLSTSRSLQLNRI
tara:strand:- start:5 stop:388 length:384 start_codon:yes stop_codon:yes gene_type:complete